MVQRAGLLKRRWLRAGTFPVNFFSSLSFLNLGITLPFPKSCYAFEEKSFFSTTIILGKKVIISRLIMNQKISYNLNNLFVKGFKRLKIDF